MLVKCRTMCAWYVVFNGKKPGAYTSWAQCSEQVFGYSGAVHRKYSSYEQAWADFNSTVNSIPLNILTLCLLQKLKHHLLLEVTKM